jgi:hypothetical protein
MVALGDGGTDTSGYRSKNRDGATCGKCLWGVGYKESVLNSGRYNEDGDWLSYVSN